MAGMLARWKARRKARALVRLGTRLRQARHYESAHKAFESAVALDPQNAAGWAWSAAALGDLERYDEALDACERARA